MLRSWCPETAPALLRGRLWCIVGILSPRRIDPRVPVKGVTCRSASKDGPPSASRLAHPEGWLGDQDESSEG